MILQFSELKDESISADQMLFLSFSLWLGDKRLKDTIYK